MSEAGFGPRIPDLNSVPFDQTRFVDLRRRLARKRLKPFSRTGALTTRLKPGANESGSPIN